MFKWSYLNECEYIRWTLVQTANDNDDDDDDDDGDDDDNDAMLQLQVFFVTPLLLFSPFSLKPNAVEQ